MKKKWLSVILCIVMIASVMSGCGKKTDTTEPENTTPGVTGTTDTTNEEEATISMFITSPEYADAINTLITEYKKEKPNVTINYETTQNDYPTLLKAKLNSGTVPDIFASTSGKEIDVYKEYSLDLSDQPLMDSMLPAIQEAMADSEGKGMYGIAIKGNFFGLVYNKELFTKAGIDKFPETITELKAACEKLKAADITPFTSGFAEWWVYKHIFQHFLAASTDDVRGLIQEFNSGEAKIKDYPELYDNYFQFIDLVKQYGDAKPLETDLSAEISNFAAGKAAIMVGQGAWVESDIKKIDDKIQIGFAGYPVSEDAAQSQVITGSDQALRINKDSKQLQAVLDFVNWWYTSDYGKAWFTDVAGVVPPVEVTTESKFEIIKQGTASVEEKGSAPLGVIYSTDAFHTAFGEAMQAYVGGTADKDETSAAIESSYTDIDASK